MWFTPPLFGNNVALTGLLRLFTPPMFSHEVAFTGFLLGLLQGKCTSENGWTWATASGQVNFDLHVRRQEDRSKASGLPIPGCEDDVSKGDAGLKPDWS